MDRQDRFGNIKRQNYPENDFPSKSSTLLYVNSKPLALDYRSRRLKINGKYFYLQIEGCWVVQIFDKKASIMIAQIRETSDRNSILLDWRIPLEGNLELIFMTEIWLGIISPKDTSKESLSLEKNSNNEIIRCKALSEASHGLNDVAVKRKVVKIDSNGSVDLSFSEWKGNLGMHKKNRRPRKSKQAKAAIANVEIIRETISKKNHETGKIVITTSEKIIRF
jgi:hypothetical protein